MTANVAPTDRPHDTRDLRRQLIVATALLFLMLYPHGGALGLASAPLFLLCLHAFVRIGAGLYTGEPVAASIFGCSAPERGWLRCVAVTLAVLQLFRAPGDALAAGTSWLPHCVLALLLGAIAVWATRKPAPHSQRRSVVLAIVATLATAAVFAYLLRHASSPRIDVFLLQQRGAQLLLAGQNPYSALYQNPYDPVETTAFFGHYTSTLDHYPYPPLSLLLTTLCYALFGDVRWLFLLCHLAVAAVLYRLGKTWQQRRKARPDLGLILLCIHLLHPRGFLVIEQAWTEPLLACALALWVWFRASRTADVPQVSDRMNGQIVIKDSLLLGLVLSAKQYALLLLFPYLSRSLFAKLSPPWLRHRRLSSLLLALLPLVAGYVALAAWQPADFLEDVVLFQLKQPFRSEALSLPALLYALSDIKLPGFTAALGLLLPLGLLGLVRPGRLPPRLGGQLLLAGLAFVGFFATAKQAFCNYYYFVGVVLLLALTQLEEAPAEQASAQEGAGRS